MRYLFGIALAFVLLLPATARAELMGVQLRIEHDQQGGWDYIVMEGDEKVFTTDNELAEYFLELSNPGDSIWLFIESEDEVSVEQMIKILEMVEANPEGITLKKVLLDSH